MADDILARARSAIADDAGGIEVGAGLVRELVAEVERLRSSSESRTLTCDAGCLIEGAAMEECSAHGRTPADLWSQLDIVRKQRDDALAEVERLMGALNALAVEWERAADHCTDDGANAVSGCAIDLLAVLRGDQ